MSNELWPRRAECVLRSVEERHDATDGEGKVGVIEMLAAIKRRRDVAGGVIADLGKCCVRNFEWGFRSVKKCVFVAYLGREWEWGFVKFT